MKDAEQRELLASLKTAFEQGMKDADAHMLKRFPTIAHAEERHEEIMNRLTRIQECTEAGRRFEKFELPSPRVPMFAGILIGALIFAAGMFAGTFLK